ncbi:toxin-activating lysine-acyltransferase [Hydrogenophaga sp. PAMC20947]|uniref:toxin-activating lysine-acyltransferase n=1 Tax=Hydrogenophaga sp. PAMC20947 TaxID=2565558 RepID=UPI001FF864F8|nr:toxin-activating lysine-acyltransferase [Hydrogenophaga sp. PAMC20947]
MKDNAPIMTAEDAQKVIDFAKGQASKMFHKLPLLGPVTWLMMQQAHTRHTLLSELEWRVIPALMLDQAKLYMRDESPLAYVSWARLSPEAAQRYRTLPHQLSFNDWNSGNETWLVDVITPFGGLAKVMEELRKGVLAGQAVQQLAPTSGEPSKAVTWPPL